MESKADNSKVFTGGQATDNSKYLNPLASAADRSKPYTGGVQYDKGPYVTPQSVPIPSGPMSTGGDGAGTVDSGPTGGSASTPSAPSTGMPSTGTPTSGAGQLPFPLPLPLPYPSGGGVYGGSIGGGAVLTSASTPVSVTTADVSAEAMPAAAATSNVDLVIEDIQLDSPATLVAGPAYRVKFRNQGTAAAANFQVALLAGLDGKLADDAPRAVVEVASLAAGQVGEVVLRLPQRALLMKGTAGGKLDGLHSPVPRGRSDEHGGRERRKQQHGDRRALGPGNGDRHVTDATEAAWSNSAVFGWQDWPPNTAFLCAAGRRPKAQGRELGCPQFDLPIARQWTP